MYMIDSTARGAGPNIKSGRTRALCITTGPKRFSMLPEVPTVAEQGLPGFNVASWFGIMAPADTPAAIVQRLYGEIAKITESAEMKKFLLTQGAEPMLMDPPKFSEFLRVETEKWGKVVKGAKPQARLENRGQTPIFSCSKMRSEC